jgi:hypothetical protein
VTLSVIPPTQNEEPSHIYWHVEPSGPLVDGQSQFVLVDATDTSKKHELSRHQEHSLRTNFIQGTNHTNLQHDEGYQQKKKTKG